VINNSPKFLKRLKDRDLTSNRVSVYIKVVTFHEKIG